MNGIQTVEGTLAGIDFTIGTTVSYRIPGDPPVSGRTIIIPDGYTAREKALIRHALAQLEMYRPLRREKRWLCD